MAFNFGPPKQGSEFVLPTSTATTASGQINFGTGAGDSKSQTNLSNKPSLGSIGASAGFGGFSVGNTVTTAATVGSTPATGLSFGTATTISAPATAFSLATSASAVPLQFSFGPTTAISTAPVPSFGPTTTPTATTTITPSFGLGTTASSAASVAPGFSLGALTPTTTTTTTTPSFGALGTISTTAVTSTPSLSLGAAVTSILPTPAVEPARALTFSQLEDSINKWTIDLEELGKVFGNQAKQLTTWDRLLIANGEKIITLNSGIERVKQQQQQLDNELDFVLSQQRELEDCIAPLEKEVENLQVVDSERNQTFHVAESLDTQLKQISEDLKEIIEHINESNKTQELSDPITQIARILNAHMNSLQWIDRNTAQISTHLDQIAKMHDLNRRNHEINLHRTYE